MWKRSFTFLVVCLLVLCSLSAHPGWLYGKKAESPATETQTTEAPEPTCLMPVEPVALDPASMPDETQPLEEQTEPGEALRALLIESNLDEAVLEAVFSYLDMVDAGIQTMTEAYEAEVASHEESEARYNNLVDNGVKLPKTELEAFVAPSVMYSLHDQTFGAGVDLGLTYGRYGMTIGVVKPSIPTLGSLKDPGDLMVSAGFVFKF